MIEGSDGVRKVIVLRADREEITRSKALEKIVREWTSNHEKSLSKKEEN